MDQEPRMSEHRRSVPPVTDTVRAQARENPGAWVYVIDPSFNVDGEVPPFGIVGAWKVDDRGEITGDFRHNPNYRPSPLALDIPPPTDSLDEAVHRAATGYGTEDDLVDTLLDHDLLLIQGNEGGIFVAHDDRGRFVQVFSSDEHLPERWSAWPRMRGRDLAALVTPDCDLEVNPESPARVRIPGKDLAAALQQSPP
ncbi:MAG: type VII secretion system-associated protein [Actinomycetota bacterium]